MSKRTFVGICVVPLAVLVVAFFLLPMARLILTGASGQDGLRAYAAILLDPRYRATLFNTVFLAAATTIATLVIATISGLFLQRHRFPGHALLVAMLTFPLAFPGVVVGFMIILLAGRQGLLGDLTLHLFGTKEVFAYSLRGLFLGYLYFSIPRVILTIMAAAEKLDPSLEEAARLDGCSNIQAFYKIALPTTAPGLAATTIFCFLFSWNELMMALTLTSLNVRTSPVFVISEFVGYLAVEWGLLSAAGILIVLPMLIFVVAIQKNLVRGLTMGAVK